MIVFQSYFVKYLEHHSFVIFLLQSRLNENVWILNSTSECLFNNEVQPCIISLIRYFVDSSQALSSESVEKLPVFNKSAFKHYQMSSEADDWCIPSKEPKSLAKEKVAA